MTAGARDAIVAERLGAAVVSEQALGGGCISTVTRLRLKDGREVVAKEGDPGGGFALEAWMLARLGDSGWPVPPVLHASNELLLLDYVESDGQGGDRGEEHAAELLAALHAIPAPQFGLERDTVIAGLPQRNAPSERWVPFFTEHRLLAMTAQAREAGRLTPEMHRRIEALAGRLPDWLREPEHPTLIHGDLWGGNMLFHRGRLAAVIDPACYCADAEIELAFATLFHSLGEAFFRRYGELRPIAPGFFEERRDLYNLYPLLVHLRLFGAAYAASIDATLRRFGF